MRLFLLLTTFGSALAQPLSGKIVFFGNQGTPAMSTEAVMASNGPTLPEDGLLGRLVFLDSDVTGCSGTISTLNMAFATMTMSPSGERPIVLLERSFPSEDTSVCSFEDKVTIVQQAGAAAAVIFDYKSEGPITMIYAHPEGVDIPAVFISHEAGEALLEAMVDQHARPLILLRPPPPPPLEEGGRAAARFELVSFTTGYLLLLLCALPVALHNAVALLKRRQALEALLRAVSTDAHLKAAVEAHEDLAEHLPLPSPATLAGVHPPGKQGDCLRLHRFLGLALTIYVAQMMLHWVMEPPGAVAAGDTSAPAAALFGINEVLNALILSALLVLFHRCFGACVRCVCGPPEEEGEEDQDQEAPQDAKTSTADNGSGDLASAKVARFSIGSKQAVVTNVTLAEPLIVTTRVPAQYVTVVSTASSK
mmetsp:Transcript_32685/g.59689  ORF Transcript_32685/g.59689 Transcript_32685/m.59689 type:complete len:422 (+) Transcript_32685:88-1353(+)